MLRLAFFTLLFPILFSAHAHAITIGEPARRPDFVGAWVKHFQFAAGAEIPHLEQTYPGADVDTGLVSTSVPDFQAVSRVDLAKYEAGNGVTQTASRTNGDAYASIRDAFWIDSDDGARSHLDFDVDLHAARILTGARGYVSLRVILWGHQAGLPDRINLDSWEQYFHNGVTLLDQDFSISLDTRSIEGLLDEHWAHLELEFQVLGGNDFQLDALSTLALADLTVLDPTGAPATGVAVTSAGAPANPLVNFEQSVPEPALALLVAAGWAGAAALGRRRA